MGAYLGMIIGRGTVVGESITVFSEALVLLSKIEGYQGALATEDCSYIRELLGVRRFSHGQWLRLKGDFLNQDSEGLARVNH